MQLRRMLICSRSLGVSSDWQGGLGLFSMVV